MEKISIIIPVYNVEQYLEKCISSVTNQSYANLEILLINDGSTDKSPALCDALAKADSRIKVIHKKSSGVSDTRNRGIDAASGKLISFVDSDDIIAPDMIETLHRSLRENGCDISTCGVLNFKEGHQPESHDTTSEVSVLSADNALAKMLYQREIVNGPVAKLFKKSLFSNIRFPKGIVVGEDLDINYQIFSKAKRVSVSPSRKYYYLQRTGSAMHSVFSLSRMHGLAVAKKIHNDAEKRHPDILKSAKNRLFMEAIYIAIEVPYSKAYKKERRECIRLIHTLSKEVASDNQSKPRFKQYALLSSLSPNLLICLLKLRRYV